MGSIIIIESKKRDSNVYRIRPIPFSQI